jgi:hypothetical protein
MRVPVSEANDMNYWLDITIHALGNFDVNIYRVISIIVDGRFITHPQMYYLLDCFQEFLVINKFFDTQFNCFVEGPEEVGKFSCISLNGFC